MAATAMAAKRRLSAALALELAARRYCRSGAPKAWQRVLEMGLELVRGQAKRVLARLPGAVEEDDLVQEGVFGLADAAASYDPGRGVRFATYAATRIRGAMLDYLRSIDWVPRLTRHRARVWAQVAEQCWQQTGEWPDEQTLQEKLGVTGERYERIRRDSEAVRVMSLEQGRPGQDEGEIRTLGEVLVDRRQAGPEQVLLHSDFEALLAAAPSRALRLILTLYYGEGMTLREIGQVLDLSESRISQMLTAVLGQLREALV